MNQFEFNPVAYLGTEKRTTNTEVILGLESMKNEIISKGMNRDIFQRVETILPGTLSGAGIDIRRLTINHSQNQRQVAVEAIDVAAALKGATGALGTTGTAIAGAGILAGLGYLMYRFYKWAKNGFGKGSKEGSDSKPDAKASDASDSVNNYQNKRPIPDNAELKAIYETYVKNGDAKQIAIARSVVSHCDTYKFSPNVAAAACEKAIQLAQVGDGANVLVEYLLDNKDGIHPHWMIHNLISPGDVTAAVVYMEWVAKLVPLVTKPIEDGSSLEKRVVELRQVFANQGLSADLGVQKDEQQGGYIKRVLSALVSMLAGVRSKTLEQIINQSHEAHISEKVKNALDIYKSEKYSFFADISGAGIANAKPINKNDFSKMLAFYNNADDYRRNLAAAITSLNQIMDSIATGMGKEVVSEEDVKAMSSITNLDKSKNVDLQFSALSQAAYKHVGFALRYKATLDFISKEVGSVSKTFIDLE